MSFHASIDPHESHGLDERNPSDPELKIWSCVICRRRKVRCDRRDPCNNCTKNNIECHFPVTGRLPRRSRDPAAQKSPSEKQGELIGRLRRLEAVVTELTAQVEEGPQQAQGADNPLLAALSQATESSAAGSSIDSQSVDAGPNANGDRDGLVSVANRAMGEPDEEFGSLVVDNGGSLQIGKGFWSVFCDEVDNIFQAVQDVINIPQDLNKLSSETRFDVSGAIRDHHQSFLLGGGLGDGRAVDDLSPLPSQMLFIWKTYVDNVDPFIKVLHVPTTEAKVREVKGRLNSLETDMEALMFTICLAAIASMNETDVDMNFGTSKPVLLARYRLGTEQALAKAEFLTPKSLIIVQAFVIYLSILPHIGARQLAWPLTGLLVRVATSLGLHRDPSSTGVTSSGSQLCGMELRRRLWWQICFVDSQSRDPRSPEMGINEAMFDTKTPINIDDKHLSTGFIDRDIPGSSSTDTTLCLIRCEIWRLNRALRANRNKTLDNHVDMYQKARSKIESTYLHNFDDAAPFDLFVHTMANLFFARIELVIYRQHFQHSADLGEPVFGAALAVIEAIDALRCNREWARWRWQLQNGVPWNALGIVLSQICRRPWNELSARALKCAQGIIDGFSGNYENDPLWPSLSLLLARAHSLEETQTDQLPSTGAAVQHHTAVGQGQEELHHAIMRATISDESHSGSGQFYSSPNVVPPTGFAAEPFCGQADFAAPTWQAAAVGFPHDNSDWNLLHGSCDSAPISLATTGSSDGLMDSGLVPDPQSFGATPMDWQSWDRLTGMDEPWDFAEF